MAKYNQSDYKLHFEERPEYLYVLYSGPRDSLDISKKAAQQIHAKMKEKGYQKILIEENLPTQLSTIEIFQVVEFIIKIFGHQVTIAHVDKQISDMDLNKFGETVGVNRGFDVRVFNKTVDAEKWLMQS